MKVTVIIVSLFVFICLFGFSCKKNDQNNDLPSATTTGEGTMGFLVDGKTWIAHSNDFKLYKTGAKYWTLSQLEIYGVSHPKSRLELTLINPQTGSYQFTTLDDVRYILYDYSPTFYLDKTDSSNSLIITRCDTGVISGTFSFKLKSSNGAIVNITSGRFDIAIK